jgi:nucleoside-diphosphate-sugar epimerase
MSNMSFSNYGILKLIGEKYSSSLNGLFTKFWNVFGLETDENKAHVISDFLRMASESSEIKMLTDGTEVRDFLFAEDAGMALESIRKNYEKFARNESVDIARFKKYSIFEVAETISKIYLEKDREIKILKGNKNDNVQKGVNNVPKTDILQFWKPKYELSDGIKILMANNDKI